MTNTGRLTLIEGINGLLPDESEFVKTGKPGIRQDCSPVFAVTLGESAVSMVGRVGAEGLVIAKDGATVIQLHHSFQAMGTTTTMFR